MINITYVNEMEKQDIVIASLISAFKERHGAEPTETDLSKILKWAKVIVKGKEERLLGNIKV
jgi:hypothetical protein